MIQGCINKKSNCQHKLFTMYAGRFMALCERYAADKYEAEDMLQEGFIRIFSYLHQYKFEGSFEGWMRRVMVNCALKHLQKKKLQFIEITENTADTITTITAFAYEEMSADELMKLIHQLPPGYKAVFNLVVIEGYSHEEVAELLQIKASTSRSQLVKARKMLQYQIIEQQKIAV